MTAIITYQLPPTVKRGNRIKAYEPHKRKSVTLSWESFSTEEENHKLAFFAYIRKFLPFENRPFAFATMPDRKKVWILIRNYNTVEVEFCEEEVIRDPNHPCKFFIKATTKVPTLTTCNGNGHYLCKVCKVYCEK